MGNASSDLREDARASHGAWMYKRLFWEAGAVGQMLYLAAEAIDIAATGIGCYFDDPVHKIFGLRQVGGDPDDDSDASAHPQFQSLYHFTCGGAVEDDRIKAL